jgi:hypothetical protein
MVLAFKGKRFILFTAIWTFHVPSNIAAYELVWRCCICLEGFGPELKITRKSTSLFGLAHFASIAFRKLHIDETYNSLCRVNSYVLSIIWRLNV